MKIINCPKRNTERATRSSDPTEGHDSWDYCILLKYYLDRGKLRVFVVFYYLLGQRTLGKGSSLGMLPGLLGCENDL